MNAVSEWWHSKTPREQGILAWGSLIVILIVLYTLAWLPLSRERTRLEAAIPAQRAEVAELKSLADAVTQARTTQQPAAAIIAANDLSARLTAAAQTRAISPKPAEVRLIDTTRATLQLREAHASRALLWLSALPQETGWRVETAEISHTAPGVVEVTATVVIR